MAGAFEIVVGGEEKGLEVPYEDVIEREHGVKEQRVDVLKSVPSGAGFVGGKPEDAASGEGVVFAVEIDAGVVASMVEDTPHVRVDSADIEDVVERFIDGRDGRDGVVVAVVCDVQQKEGLGHAAQEIKSYKLPRIQLKGVEDDPTAGQHCETCGDLDPHGAISFWRDILVCKEPVEAAAQHLWEWGETFRLADGLRLRVLKGKAFCFRIEYVYFGL